MKQIEDIPKDKSRALAVIQDDEGFNWNNFLPEEDAERYEEFLRSKESKKVDEGIIDVKAEMTAENLTKMADQIMMAKALEVDSTSACESESSEKVSSSGSDSEPGKAENAKSESDRRNCMKECKVCNTHEYLSQTQIKELTNKIKILNREVIGREKLVKSSTDRINELTEKIKTNENDVEHFRKENEKLMLENRKFSEDFDKLKRIFKDSDKRNIETRQENLELSGVLQAKEKLINAQLDKIENLKLQYQEANIENERINLKLNTYTSANFVRQHIVPKSIGQNKEGEDVYCDNPRVQGLSFSRHLFHNLIFVNCFTLYRVPRI
ncbi:hypothetical protein Hanom_Chr03g00209331 [Helianthus anomalus]